MPKRNRGKNSKKGSENSTIPVDCTATKSEIVSEIILADKASIEEKPESIKSEILQVDVKDKEKNQAEIQVPEKQNDNVQQNLPEPQNLELKQDGGKSGLQTVTEPSALKQEPQNQNVQKSEQRKSTNKSNKQSMSEQKRTEATSEVKLTESVKNEQKQNKPGNQSEIKQPDQQRKGETKKVGQSPAGKQKENNKKAEVLKPDTCVPEQIRPESQEKTKAAEPINDQAKSTKSVKPNAKQTQPAKSEAKPDKPSTGKEQPPHLIKQDLKQSDSEKNNEQVEESGAKASVVVKDEINENKLPKLDNKKQELPKHHSKKAKSPKHDAKKTDVDEVQNNLSNIDTNPDKGKNPGEQNTLAHQSPKQSGAAGTNIKEQKIAKENEQGRTQVLKLDASAPKSKKTDLDNTQLEVEMGPEKSKSTDKPTTLSKKGTKPGNSSVKENEKKNVQGKTESKQADAKPINKKDCKPNSKQAIPNKSSDKKNEHKKTDITQNSVTLSGSSDATPSESLTEKTKTVDNDSQISNLASIKSEIRKESSINKEAVLNKSDVNLPILSQTAETVQLNVAKDQTEAISQKQPKALLVNPDLKQAINAKQSDITTDPSGKTEPSILDIKKVMHTTPEDVNAQTEISTQSIPLNEEIQHSDDIFIECNKPDNLESKLVPLGILEQTKTNVLNEDSSKLAELKEVPTEIKDCKVTEVKEAESIKAPDTALSLPAPDLMETQSSESFNKEIEISNTENIQLTPSTNEIKISHSNRVDIKTEPLTYAQVAETPKVENKTKSAEEQASYISNSSAKHDDGEDLKEALSCALPKPSPQKESENKKETSVSTTPQNVGIEKKKSIENKGSKDLNPKEAIESSTDANASIPHLPSSEAPQVQEISHTPTDNQEESVNVQELTEHVMNILNEGGTDQHDLLKKNVELQQFIVKLIHLLKEKTDLCANLDRQNSALTSQAKSLKDVIAITKDLLGIRNLEVDRLHGDLNLMDNAIKEERTRHNTAVQHLTEAMGINDKLKKEYHIQMDLFEKLKEKYTEKVVILTRENMRMKALLEQHGIDPSAVPDCMLPVDPENIEPSQTESVDK